MDKEQALHQFWSQFGVEAFDRFTTPEEAAYPRITYECATDNIGAQLILTGSLWDRSTSWKTVTDLLHTIEAKLGLGGQTINFEGGLLWVKKATPFSQRVGDEDDSIRRIIVNIEVEFISEV